MVVVELVNKSSKELEVTFYVTYRVKEDVLRDGKASINTSLLRFEAIPTIIEIIVMDRKGGEQ